MAKAADREPDYTYAAALISVTDADTVRLLVDVGFRMYAKIPIRPGRH
jgi:hypothetical protein